MKETYMAYVGSYSYNGQARGITVYDVDVEKGVFNYRCEVDVDNSSYLIAANNGKTLYSIADEGVVSFRIHENGSITRLNSANIRGMRGCHLSTDSEGQFIYVSGYHDGKATVLHLNPDGSVGEIADGVYHKGLGNVAERNFRPHVTCTRRTPDGKYVMTVDLGIDQVKIYGFDPEEGRLTLVDTLRCELESAPKCFRFSSDGRFFYLVNQLKNNIEVYSYETGIRTPKIEKLQTISSTGDKPRSQMTAACCLRFSPDEKHLFCGNAGDESVSVYKRDEKNGLLELLCCLPISGEYPKDLAIFPDDKHLASINNESNSITFFSIDYKKKLLVMSSKTISINEPNSCVIVKVRN